MRSLDGDVDVIPERANRYRSPQGDPTRSSFAAHNGRSVADLLRDLSTETVSLVRQELELARAEMRDKLDVYQRSTIALGGGAALLLAALMTGLWALNTGLTALLAQSMDLDVAVWLSPAILTVVLGAMGWGMIRGAMSRMKDEGLVPRQTTAALRDDKRWAQEKAHEIKEEITHGR
jgi:hypothetical protein